MRDMNNDDRPHGHNRRATMGRGDRRTAKGKRFSKSFGKTRSRKSKEQKKGESTSTEPKAADKAQ